MAVSNPPLRVDSSSRESAVFSALSARRLLLLGGIGLILVGMIFGDIFAVFVLHQNAARVVASLSAAAHAALSGDASAVAMSFRGVGSFLENRGTKVDTHVHMIDFGYLALLLAILQPWVALTEKAKRRLAWLFLFGAGLLPVCVFLIHYVGLAYSPLAAIGWASIFADFGGFLVLLATLGYLFGLWKHHNAPETEQVKDDLLSDRSATGRLLLSGGVLLVLIGFLHGAYYAAVDLYHHEEQDYTILSNMSLAASQKNGAAVDTALDDYGQLQGDKAVKIAAHAHIIEFGLLAMMLAFFQPYVSLHATWKRRWAIVLLLGSVLLPVCVLLELKFGLLAGGLADFGGLLVILALLAMWIGILRYTGSLDASTNPIAAAASRRPGAMSSVRRLLLLGGITLAIWGMGYGLWYAVFAEHQALDGIGASLAGGFSAAAQRDSAQVASSLEQYREAKYNYDRQVDVHGHWIGLAMLLIVIGIGFDRLRVSDRTKLLLALGLSLGAIVFPLGVLLQTISHELLPRGVAIVGSALVIVSLASITLGFARNQAQD
jgi:hypothetical protein